MSSAGWCCSVDDGEGLWYTDKYPEDMFFDHWAEMAERYTANPMVIAADLRNEIRRRREADGTVTLALWGSGRAEQGANSIENKFGLSLSLKNHWLEIPYTNKKFKNKRLRHLTHMSQNQNGISSRF